MQTFFRRLFDLDDIKNKFNYVELTLVPKIDQLEKVFSLEQINTLRLVIRRPNTDGLEDLEDEVLNRLNQQNAAEEIITYKAQDGLSVEPDDTTKALGHIAQLNGEVVADGYDGTGKRVQRSTENKPYIESEPYNPNEKTARDHLYFMADVMIKKVREMARLGRQSG